ncbi:hypothetical protein [Anaerobutyricum hallii]|jgi:hypothetical protein|uniref:hypothetical protein n=1 Tax=Anaerobutyricum hallii TaxID=39488 RepID=UPI003A86C271
MKKSNEEKTYATLKLGKTYKFAGYNWMACEVDNDRHVVVIQSHGVTHGAWPGYTMPQFGNGNYYSNSIDGKDISDYDDKMRALYDDIKDAEDKAAPYGEGLYLISVEKAEFKEWDNTGSGNYWQALKATAENAHSFRDANYFAWLGADNGSKGAWCVDSDGCFYNYFNKRNDFVIAPCFNLDLSKVKVVDNEIVIIDNKFGISLIEKPDVYGLVKSEIIKMYDMLDTDEVYPLEISGSQSSAMGFITQKAAEVIDYDYENSGLNEFISSILDDMDKESEDSIYDFHGVKIHLER